MMTKIKNLFLGCTLISGITPLLFTNSTTATPRERQNAIDAKSFNFDKITFPHWEKFKFYGTKFTYDDVNHAVKACVYIDNHDVSSGHYYLVANYMGKTTTYQFQLNWGLQSFDFLLPFNNINNKKINVTLAFTDVWEWIYHHNDYDNYGYKYTFNVDFQQYTKLRNHTFVKGIDDAKKLHDYVIKEPVGVFESINGQYNYLTTSLTFNTTALKINKDFFTNPYNDFLYLTTNPNFNIINNLNLKNIIVDGPMFKGLVLKGDWSAFTFTLFSTRYKFHLTSLTNYDPWVNKVNNEKNSNKSGIQMPLSGNPNLTSIHFEFVYNNNLYEQPIEVTIQLPSFKNFLYYSGHLNIKYNNSKFLPYINPADSNFSFNSSTYSYYHNHFSKADYENLGE